MLVNTYAHIQQSSHFKVIPAHAEDSYENTNRAKNRALTVQAPILRGYITKKNAKSYDLTFNIWCTSRDSNPGPTD